MTEILICDNDDNSTIPLTVLLEHEGFRVHRRRDGKSAAAAADSLAVWLVILDVTLPDMNGMELIDKFRRHSDRPVIIVSSRNSDTDRIMGLSMGADDYIGKPFNPLEVMTRVKTILRRCPDAYAEEERFRLSSGGLTILRHKATAYLDGEQLPLTRTEYNILECLMNSKGHVIPKRMIYRQVWKEEPCAGCERVVSMHLWNLRKKIEPDISNPIYLKRIWGEGYKLEDIR